MSRYLQSGKQSLVVRRGAACLDLPTAALFRAITHFNGVVEKFREFDVDVFSILGMRNLSAFIGELYAASVIVESDGAYLKNPHQDGYPDLLIMDAHGRGLWDELSMRVKDKAPFSPFAGGGIEVKATCGSVPTPAVCRRRGIEKPGMGETRISMLTGYDWKAHHRETNNLIGLLWDFVDGIPRITAAFYSSNLEESDWGRIIQPREGGGRTTSVSIMGRSGIRKMYEGWLFVLEGGGYREFIDSYNRGRLLTSIGDGRESGLCP